MFDATPAGRAEILLTIRDQLDAGLAAARAKMGLFQRSIEASGTTSAAQFASAAAAATTAATAAGGATVATLNVGRAVQLTAKSIGHWAILGKAVAATGRAGAFAAGQLVALPARLAQVGGLTINLLGRLPGMIGAGLSRVGPLLAAAAAQYAGWGARIIRPIFGGMAAVANRLAPIFANILGPIGRIVGRGFGYLARGAGATAGLLLRPFQAIGSKFAELGAFSGRAYWLSWKTAFLGRAMRGVGFDIRQPGAAAAIPAAGLAAPAAAAGQTAAGLGALGTAATAAAAPVALVTAPLRRLAVTATAAGNAMKTLGLSLAGAGAGLALIAAPVALLVARFQQLGKKKPELLTPQQAALATATANAWGNLKKTATDAIDAIAINLGSALAPRIQDTADNVSALIGIVRTASDRIGKWMSANAGTVSTLGTLALWAGVAGAALVGLGAALGVAGFALSSLGTVLAVVTNPFVLLTAGLAAGAVYFFRFTAAGRAAGQALSNAFGPALGTIRDTIGGIRDALTAGEFQTAAEIAGRGAKVGLMQGLKGIESLLPDGWEAGIGDVKNLTSDLLQGNWEAAVADMRAIWAGFCKSIVSLMGPAVSWVGDAWRGSVQGIADQLLKWSAQGGALGKIASGILGADMNAEQAQRELMDLESRRKQIDNLNYSIANYQAMLAKLDETGTPESLRGMAGVNESLIEGRTPEELRAELQGGLENAQRELANAEGNTGTTNLLAEAQRSVSTQIDQWLADADTDLETTRQQARRDAGAARQRKGTSTFDALLAKEQEALARLNADMKAKADKVRAATQAPPPEEGPANADAGRQIGTFNAWNLGQIFGGGDDVQKQQLDRLVAIATNTGVSARADRQGAVWR